MRANEIDRLAAVGSSPFCGTTPTHRNRAPNELALLARPRRERMLYSDRTAARQQPPLFQGGISLRQKAIPGYA